MCFHISCVLISAQHSALRGCDLVGYMFPTLHYEPSTEVYVPYGFLTCALINNPGWYSLRNLCGNVFHANVVGGLTELPSRVVAHLALLSGPALGG